MTFGYAINNNKVEDLGTPDRRSSSRHHVRRYISGPTNPSHLQGRRFRAARAPDRFHRATRWVTRSDRISTRRSCRRTINSLGNAINVMCDDGKGGSVACASAPFVFLGRTTPTRRRLVHQHRSRCSTTSALGALVDFKRDYVKVDGSQRFRCVVNRRCEEWYYPQRYDPKVIASLKAGTDVLPDGYINDASYTKLREVSVSYTLPPSFNHFGKFSRAVIGIAGRNLHTWTKWPGLDPEAFFLGGSRGGGFALFDQTTNPQATQWVVNLNLAW